MTFACHHCNTPLPEPSSGVTLKVGFRDTCLKCSSDLHVCLNCEFYDEGSHHECRESSAEWVRSKDRGNVCEYFRIRGTEGSRRVDKSAVLGALDDLFKK